MVVEGGRAVVVVVVLCNDEIIGDRNMEFIRLKNHSSNKYCRKKQGYQGISLDSLSAFAMIRCWNCCLIIKVPPNIGSRFSFKLSDCLSSIWSKLSTDSNNSWTLNVCVMTTEPKIQEIVHSSCEILILARFSHY